MLTFKAHVQQHEKNIMCSYFNLLISELNRTKQKGVPKHDWGKGQTARTCLCNRTETCKLLIWYVEFSRDTPQSPHKGVLRTADSREAVEPVMWLLVRKDNLHTYNAMGRAASTCYWASLALQCEQMTRSYFRISEKCTFRYRLVLVKNNPNAASQP